MRLIDADELLLRFIPRGGDNDLTRFVRETVLLRLAEMPKVEAEPVKHGHWTNISISVTGNSSAECSLCGTVVHDTFADVSRINYCPNCGAKMDEVTDEVH